MTATSASSAGRIRVAEVCAADVSVKALLRPQIEALIDAGYDVVSVCSDGERVPELRARGLRIHTVPITRRITPARDLRAIWLLLRFFRRYRPTVVHTHTPKAAFLAQVAATLAGVPVRVNTIHGYYFPAARGIKRRLFRRMELLTCALSHHVFSQSGEDVELTLRDRLLPADKIELIGNGIDLDRFRPDRFTDEDRRRMRAELRIPENAFVVGIVARMVREKGFAELFEAFARLREKAPNAYLLHTGLIDRSRGDEITPQWAARHGIASYCRFAGQRDDVPRVLHAMDVFCLPSYREGYPRSVLEANAMGLPAVVTDIRGCREAVEHGRNGLVVAARQVQPLADALYLLYTDPEMRLRMGQAARERAEAAFDERVVLRKIVNRFHSLTTPMRLPDEAMEWRYA